MCCFLIFLEYYGGAPTYLTLDRCEIHLPNFMEQGGSEIYICMYLELPVTAIPYTVLMTN